MNRSCFCGPGERKRTESVGGPSDPAEFDSSGSALCRKCGLCCDGSWFETSSLTPDEVSLARELGLAASTSRNGDLSFRQPCPHHLSDSCAIYERRRPASCSRYRCRLLHRYQQGEATFEESLRPIQRARELIKLFETHSGAGQDFRAKLGRIVSAPDTLLMIDANARSGMIAAALLALYRRHFEVTSDPLHQNQLNVASDRAKSAT